MVENSKGWRDVIVKLADVLTDDKTVAMVCLTAIGYWVTNKYPVQASLPVITAIVSGIAGFVVGTKTKG